LQFDATLRTAIWKCPMPDLGEDAFKNCYAEFRKHPTLVHGLKRDEMAGAYVHLNLETWTLTLLKPVKTS
jgi:hypothetical protein